jgi:hypothetical protein
VISLILYFIYKIYCSMMDTKKRPHQDIDEDDAKEDRGFLSSIGSSIGQLFGFGRAKRRKTTRDDPSKDEANNHHVTMIADRNQHPSPPSTSSLVVESPFKDTNGPVREEKEVETSPHEPTLAPLSYKRTEPVSASTYNMFSSSLVRNASSTATNITSKGKSIRFQEVNFKSAYGQTRRYRSTPYKKQMVAFESTNSSQTPHKTTETTAKKTYAKTPLPTRTGALSTGMNQMNGHENTIKSTPIYTPKYKANARAISMPSTDRKDSEQLRKDDYTRQVARDILDKANIGKVYESDATLFSPLEEREKIKATRIYGRNQSGSRMIQPLKATSTSVATTTTPSSSKDYWSRVADTNAFPSASNDNQSTVAASTVPQKDATNVLQSSAAAPPAFKYASSDVAFKRSRVELTQPDQSFVSVRKDSTPPKESVSSPILPSITGTTSSSIALKIATPTKVNMVVEYVQSPTVTFPRNNTGTINYPNKKMYGQDIVLGESSKGVTKDEVCIEDLGKRIRPKTKFYFRENGTTNTVSAKPFDLMPMEKNGSDSKKGSSSILQKPLQTLSKLKENESTAAPATTTTSVTTSTKPLAKEDASGAPAVVSGWGNIFASQKDKHKCVSCSSQYDKHLSKCPACDTLKESEDSEKAVETSSASTSGWGNIFASQKDKHKCVSCSSQYDKHLTKCPACETPKESEEPKKEKSSDAETKKIEPSSTTTTPSFSFGSATSSADKGETKGPSSNTFSFGSATSSADKGETKVPSSNTFTFGAATAKSTESSKSFTFGTISSPTPVTESSGFKFGATGAKNEEISKPGAGGFSFGAASTSDKKVEEESKPTDAPFTFGTATSSSDSEKKKEEVTIPAATNFTFGASSSSPSKPSEEKKADVSSFTFGAASASAPEIPKDAGSKTARAAFTFGSTSPSSSSAGKIANESKSTANGGFSFGSSTMSVEKKEEPTSKRQRDDNSSAPAAPSASMGNSSVSAPSFSFGTSSSQDTKIALGGIDTELKNEFKPVTTAPFTFGSSSGDGNKVSGTSTSSKFSFGSSTNTEQASESKPASGGFTFGSTSADTNQHDPAKAISTPSFTFGAGSSSVAPTPSTPAFAFGSTTATAPSVSAPSFSFGQSSQSAPSPAPSFSFGSTAGTTPAHTSALNASTPASTFSFGAPSPSGSTVPSSFTTTAPGATMTLGSNPATSAPAPFAFGASNSTASTSGPAFGGFGSGAPSPVPPFGNTPSAPAPAFSGFGAPMQQQSQGGGFAPGFSAAPAAGGFSIGSGGSNKQSAGRGGRRVIRAKRPPSNR